MPGDMIGARVVRVADGVVEQAVVDVTPVVDGRLVRGLRDVHLRRPWAGRRGGCRGVLVKGSGEFMQTILRSFGAPVAIVQPADEGSRSTRDRGGSAGSQGDERCDWWG